MQPTNPLRQHIFWAPVPGFPDYAVSDQGDVISYKQSLKGMLLKRLSDANGYVCYGLYNKLSEYCPRRAHRLVYEAFRGALTKGMHVMHLDGDTSNSNLSNLREGTASENNRMKSEHGTATAGEKNGGSKLTEKTVRSIRSMYPALTQYELADLFEVEQGIISGILTRTSWKHLAAREGEWVPTKVKVYSKLTKSEVLEIRALHPEWSYSRLARRFNCGASTIAAIIKRRSWKFI